MKDTGERLIPEAHKGHLMYGEHIARYVLSAELVKNKCALDIASGTGYGTYVLAEKAKKVFGVDISDEAVEYAKKNFSKDNIEFLQGSADKIPLEDDSFDVVNSFETIEHIDTYKEFVLEVKRVLKKDGLFIVSTPNKKEFMVDNHFHVHEFTEQEFRRLLETSFKNVKLYYQESFKGSSIHSAEDFTGQWQKNETVYRALDQPKEKSIYFIAICSDVKLPEYGSINVISENWSDKQNLIDLQLNKIAHAKALQLEKSEFNVKATEEELDSIKNSASWKITKPLRVVKTAVKKRK